MRTYLECIPCFFRQALKTTRLAGLSEDKQLQVMVEFGQRLSELSLQSSPPEIALDLYADIAARAGRDPFEEIREISNKQALDLYPRLREKVEDSRYPLRTAVRLAIAGNVIDYGTPGEFDILKEVEAVLESESGAFMFEEFQESLRRAESVLYLCDNAGEIVFDRLLIEEIQVRYQARITAAVRGGPVLNDVTLEDARQVGLDRICPVIPNGSKAPGTLLGDCSEEFIQTYNKADLLISKGQGNFETLWGEEKNIAFLFKVKCDVVARHIEGSLGDTVLFMFRNLENSETSRKTMKY
ncbi:MAG: ARMT1-like domain-containing protein [Candidatus Auribacterota bacterium]|nr:ARMT1-like domain-containing protein [Candidatus Auribacterota bacterium]